MLKAPVRCVDARCVGFLRAHRFGSLISGVVGLAVAAGWLVMALRIVFVERIGPTVATVSTARGWGVHTGDALALPAVLIAMTLFAVAVGLLHHGLAPTPTLAPLRPRRVPVTRAR